VLTCSGSHEKGIVTVIAVNQKKNKKTKFYTAAFLRNLVTDAVIQNKIINDNRIVQVLGF
jgi:hypothetical protein